MYMCAGPRHASPEGSEAFAGVCPRLVWDCPFTCRSTLAFELPWSYATEDELVDSHTEPHRRGAAGMAPALAPPTVPALPCTHVGLLDNEATVCAPL